MAPVQDDDGGTSILSLLLKQIANLAEDIRELRKEISAIRQPQYQVYLTAIGLMIAGCSALWGLAIYPLHDAMVKADDTYAKKDLFDEKYFETSKDIAAINERFKAFATKDDLNSVIIGIDRRLPSKP